MGSADVVRTHQADLPFGWITGLPSADMKIAVLMDWILRLTATALQITYLASTKHTTMCVFVLSLRLISPYQIRLELHAHPVAAVFPSVHLQLDLHHVTLRPDALHCSWDQNILQHQNLASKLEDPPCIPPTNTKLSHKLEIASNFTL